jgi:adiponectin receptor
MSSGPRRRRPPPGPFVLPQDRPPRRNPGAGAGDGPPGAPDALERQWWMCRLCTYKDAPAWSVHNKYIHTGYRTNFGWRDAFRSVLMIHNETANIWTHLLGLAIFALITLSMATGWGNTHLPALPESWRLGADHTKLRAALVAETVEFRRKVQASSDALRRVAARCAKTENEVLQKATNTIASVARAVSDRVHFGVVTDSASDTKAKLVERLNDARVLLSSAADKITHGSGMGAQSLQRLIHQLEAHHGVLSSTLEHSNVGSDWHVPLELPGDPAPRWPMYVFLSGAIVCLSFSAVCHTLACVGARVSSIVWRIDYVGIAALIVASFYPVVFYSFYCVPNARNWYLTLMTGFGFLTLGVTLADRFQDTKYSPLRAFLFSCLGGLGSFPILHQTWFVWREKPTPIAVMLWLELLMGACYLSGAVIYARAVPEKWKPGRFDLWFSSHNIFHVLVVMGAVVHYRAALVLLAWRDHHGCEADVTMLRPWYVDERVFGR